MPELPEVETVCRGLAAHLINRKITHVIMHRPDLRVPLPKDLASALTGRKIKRISRRAKYALLHLDSGKVLVVHLGMSGSLVLHEKRPEGYRKHDHVVIEFSPFMQMVFHDPRRFGLMVLVEENKLAKHKLFSALGPEPFDKTMNGTYLYNMLQKSKSPVKMAIMDQRKIVGVGNIYASEALYRAKIHPSRIANKVTRKEADCLAKDIKEVLEEAIESGGSTLRDYVRSSGDAGYFQHRFQVYGRAKEPCRLCKTPINIIKQGGRSTFFCRKCQK